jgi:hypothetical protein
MNACFGGTDSKCGTCVMLHGSFKQAACQAKLAESSCTHAESFMRHAVTIFPTVLWQSTVPHSVQVLEL